MFVALVLISIAICLIEGIPLAYKKMWKEFITVLLLLVIAILLGLVKLLEIPTPLDALENILSPMGRFIFDQKK